MKKRIFLLMAIALAILATTFAWGTNRAGPQHDLAASISFSISRVPSIVAVAPAYALGA